MRRKPAMLFTLLLLAILLLLPSCATHADEAPKLMYGTVEHDQAVEVFDTYALPAVQAGIATHWTPQYLSTVVIAIDRDQTDAGINSWSDLLPAQIPVSFVGENLFNSHIFAAIAYSIDGEVFSLATAADILRPLYAAGNLRANDLTTPVTLCFDHQAAAMILEGRNLDIIVPADGTLTFQRGLLSNGPIDAVDSRETMLKAGLRLLDGSCDSAVYPPAQAYQAAVRLADYTHLNTEFQNTTRVLRRDIMHTRRYSSADGQENQTAVLLFLAMIIIWTGAIAHRAMQKSVRRAAMITSALLIGWVLVRSFKFQLVDPGIASRYAWYGFYLFQLGIPLVSVWLASALDKEEGGIAPPKWWKRLAAVNATLALLVMTNDLHQLAFVMDLSGNSWSRDYRYGPVYFAVIGMISVEFILSQIIMVRKSRKSTGRYAVIVPIVLYAVLMIYCVGYVLRMPIFVESDMTIVTGVFTLLFMEACLLIGNVPVNRKYSAFFRQSPQRMQIIDDSGDTVLRAADAAIPERSVWQQLRASPGEPLPMGEDTLLYASPINGGMVVWHEDIRALNALTREVERAVERLRAANLVLEAEERIRSKAESASSRLKLFSALEDKIKDHTGQLSELLHSIPREPEANKRHMAKVALLVCYIKRRCNLFFLEYEKPQVAANELAVYIDELLEFAGFAGLMHNSGISLTGRVSLRHASLIYELIHEVVDWMLAHGGRALRVEVREENECIVLRLMHDAGDTLTIPAAFQGEIARTGGTLTTEDYTDALLHTLTFPRKGGGRHA